MRAQVAGKLLRSTQGRPVVQRFALVGNGRGLRSLRCLGGELVPNTLPCARSIQHLPERVFEQATIFLGHRVDCRRLEQGAVVFEKQRNGVGCFDHLQHQVVLPALLDAVHRLERQARRRRGFRFTSLLDTQILVLIRNLKDGISPVAPARGVFGDQ